MNACIDTLGVYRTAVANQPQSSGLIAPHSLRLLPLFILAIMKHVSMTLFQQEDICFCFLDLLSGLAFPFTHVFQSCKPCHFFSPDPSRLSSPVVGRREPVGEPVHKLNLTLNDTKFNYLPFDNVFNSLDPSLANDHSSAKRLFLKFRLKWCLKGCVHLG